MCNIVAKIIVISIYVKECLKLLIDNSFFNKLYIQYVY